MTSASSQHKQSSQLPAESEAKRQDIQAKKLLALEDDLKDARRLCKSLQLEKADLRRQLGPYASAEEKQQHITNRLRQELDAEKRRSDGAENKFEEAVATIAKWQVSETEWLARHERTSRALQTAEGKVLVLTAELAGTVSMLHDERAAAEELTRDADAIRSMNRDLKASVDRLHAAVQSRDEDITSLQEQYHRLIQRKDTYYAQIGALKDKELIFHQELARRERDLEERNLLLVISNNESKDLLRQLNDVSTQLAASKHEQAQAKDECERLAQLHTDITENAANAASTYQHTIAALTADLEALQQQRANELLERRDAAAQQVNLHHEILLIRNEVDEAKISAKNAQLEVEELQRNQLNAQQYSSELLTMLKHKEEENAVQIRQHTADLASAARLRETMEKDLQGALQASVSQCDELRVTLDTKESVVAALASENASIASLLAQAASTNDELQVTLKNSATKESLLIEMVATHKAAATAAMAELEVLRNHSTSAEASHHAAIKAQEASFSRERDALRLKFNIERDSVVVLRQKLTSEQQAHSLLRDQIEKKARHFLPDPSDEAECRRILQQKESDINALQVRKAEYKVEFNRLRDAYRALRLQCVALQDEHSQFAQRHKLLVRSATQRFQILRDQAKLARDLLASTLQRSDISPQSRHWTVSDAVNFTAEAGALVAALDKALTSTEPAVPLLLCTKEPPTGITTTLSATNANILLPSGASNQRCMKRERE